MSHEDIRLTLGLDVQATDDTKQGANEAIADQLLETTRDEGKRTGDERKIDNKTGGPNDA